MNASIVALYVDGYVENARFDSKGCSPLNHSFSAAETNRLAGGSDIYMNINSDVLV